MSRVVLTLGSLLLATGCAVASSSTTTSPSRSGASATAPRAADFFWADRPVGTRHTLMPSSKTVVYGGYDADATPVLRIASGDEVDLGAVSTCGARLLQPGKDSGTVEPAYREIVNAVRDSTLRRGPGGHILTGPIYVDGAEPGDVLEVRIKQVELDIPYACNSFGPRSGFLPEDFPGKSQQRIVPLDRARMIGHFSDSLGIEIPLAPFFGSMGVAPATGRLNSAPPTMHAGNLDNKELQAGTILYIPVKAKGALFEAGDGHAAQGDGEVDITALETALRGRFQFIVRKDMTLTWPRGETRTHHIAMGTDSSLTVATKIAVREAITLLADVKKMTREDAYMLVSTGCDVRITQLVDGTMGVHVMIPKRLFVR
jgi:acetamidase/formamidase